MYQGVLFDHDHLAHVVNVASVPQRSPFRYPGGKTWLVPRIRQWLNPGVRAQLGLAPTRPTEFIEPFVGGGIISLTVAAERLAEHVTMVELDEDVAAVWQTILDAEQGAWLAHQILDFNLTSETVQELLSHDPMTTAERGFQTLVRNRVNHGGILAPGSGRIKYGEDGRGIRSRWYPETLARRIREISAMRDRITFIHGNGLDIIAGYANRPDAVFFIDPPYTAGTEGKRAGRRLYMHNLLDHAALFSLVEQCRGDFLMTYDVEANVEMLANRHHFATRIVPMKNTHHARMMELLIGYNLDWVIQRAAASSGTMPADD